MKIYNINENSLHYRITKMWNDDIDHLAERSKLDFCTYTRKFFKSVIVTSILTAVAYFVLTALISPIIYYVMGSLGLASMVPGYISNLYEFMLRIYSVVAAFAIIAGVGYTIFAIGQNAIRAVKRSEWYISFRAKNKEASEEAKRIKLEQDIENERLKEERGPSFIALLYKKFKEKTCFKIEVQK